MDELEFTKWGLRFGSDETERRYREWHAQKAAQVGEAVRVRAWLAPLAVMLSVGAAGCTKILGVSDYRAAPAKKAWPEDAAQPEASVDSGVQGRIHVSSCGGVHYGSTSCRDCVDTSCCTQSTGCAADPACRATVECEERCPSGDEGCRSRCAYILGFASAEMDQLVQCEATTCRTCRSGRSLVRDPRCSLCEAEKCSAELDAFSRDQEALALRKCGTLCALASDAGCVNACTDQHSAGQESVDALEQCETGRCATACTPSAPDWACLGSVEWPPPAPVVTQLVLGIRLLKSEDFATPLGGFSVRACAEQDIDCTDPRATTKSQPDGSFTLTIPQPPAYTTWFFGHLLVTSDAPGYSPGATLIYRFPPFRESLGGGVLFVTSRPQRDTTARAVGVTLDPTRGIVQFNGFSCGARNPSSGVVVSIDTGQKVFYYGPTGGIDPLATETSAAGIGVIANVEPGTRHLSAKLATGELVGSYTVEVRADSFTNIVMAPTPAGN